jgi:hypothetical protein
MVKELSKFQLTKGLIKYLMRHWHSTPFEMCEVKVSHQASYIYCKTMDQT